MGAATATAMRIYLSENRYGFPVLYFLGSFSESFQLGPPPRLVPLPASLLIFTIFPLSSLSFLRFSPPPPFCFPPFFFFSSFRVLFSPGIPPKPGVGCQALFSLSLPPSVPPVNAL